MDDLRRIAAFGRPAWLEGVDLDGPAGADTPLETAARTFANIVGVVDTFETERRRVAESGLYSPEGQAQQRAAVAAEQHARLERLRGPAAQVRRARESVLARFRPEAPFAGAELALREAEARRYLPSDPTAARIAYFDAIEAGDALTVAAIENAPRAAPFALDAADLAEGRRRRVAAEAPEAAQELQALDAALADLDNAQHTAEAVLAEALQDAPEGEGEAVEGGGEIEAASDSDENSTADEMD